VRDAKETRARKGKTRCLHTTLTIRDTKGISCMKKVRRIRIKEWTRHLTYDSSWEHGTDELGLKVVSREELKRLESSIGKDIRQVRTKKGVPEGPRPGEAQLSPNSISNGGGKGPGKGRDVF